MSKKSKVPRAKLIASSVPGKASDASKKIKIATGILMKSGFKVDIALTKPNAKATRIARKAIKDGFTIVIAMGDDNMVSAVVRGVSGSKANLGIIPVGTDNRIASSLGIPSTLEEACALIATNKMRKLDLGEISTRKGGKSVFLGRTTIGYSGALTPEVGKVINGKKSSPKAASKAAVEQETRQWVTLTIDGKGKTKVETRLVMVTNAPGEGKDLAFTPTASLQDGLLDISVYPAFSEIELRDYFTEMRDGGYTGDRVVQRYKARKVTVKMSPKLKVMADGVALGRGRVKIKALPKVLRVIAVETSERLEVPQMKAVISSELDNPVVDNNHHEEILASLA